MPSCVYRWCKNYTGTVRDKKSVSFHRLPNDGLIKLKWLEIIRTQRNENDWMPTSYSTVCSDHFLANDIYETKTNRRKLKKTAVPIIKAAMKSVNNSYHASSRPSSPNSLENENISDLESIFETPRENVLKLQIRKIMMSRRKLLKDNNNLKRKNKRLNEKCKRLKESIAELKKVISVGEDLNNDVLKRKQQICFQE